MQPSESSLSSFVFLKVFLDLPHPLSIQSVVLFVANGSCVLFIIFQMLAHVMASAVALRVRLIPSVLSLKLMCFLYLPFHIL